MKTPMLLLAAALVAFAASSCKTHGNSITTPHDKNYDPKFHNNYYHQPHHRLRGDVPNPGNQ